MSAIERLQKQIFDKVAEIEPEDYLGSDWWQLANQESYVFNLRLDDMPLLVECYKAYQAVKGNPDFDYSQDQLLCEAVRREYPNMKEEGANKLEFMLFAEKLEMSMDGANALYTKIEWWNKRNHKTITAIPMGAAL